ncbi:MAG: hypothetical protein ACKO39_12990 [Chthoniobacterales bacterium]
MRYAAMILLLVGLAAAPLAPAATLPAPAAETCAAACCQSSDDCCAKTCHCPPVSCRTPAAPSVLIAAGEPLTIFAPGSSLAALLTDEICSERNTRPPVPPPRA